MTLNLPTSQHKSNVVLRHAQARDHAPIIAVINDWWGGRPMADMLPKLFFEHFQPTSFVLELEERIIAFLIGFVSQTDPTQAYIHFVGVDPLERASGFGKTMYEHFFEVVQALGCHSVRCVTSPVNTASIAFHRRMGFEFLTGDAEQNNAPIHTDYDGLDGSRVLFRRDLQRP